MNCDNGFGVWTVPKSLHFSCYVASVFNRCTVMNVRCWSAGQYTWHWQPTGRAPMHSLTMGTREQWSIPIPRLHGSLPSGVLCKFYVIARRQRQKQIGSPLVNPVRGHCYLRSSGLNLGWGALISCNSWTKRQNAKLTEFRPTLVHPRGWIVYHVTWN